MKLSVRSYSFGKGKFKSFAKVLQDNLRLHYKRISLGLFICYLLLCIFPGIPFSPINTGLDPSWHWGANYLAQSNYTFGLTYGPLGYLLVTLDIGPNLFQAMIFWYTLYAIFIASLFYFLFKFKNYIALSIFIIAFIVFWAVINGITDGSLNNQELFLVLVGILLGISLKDIENVLPFPAFLAGLLAGVMLYMKVNLALSTLSMIVIYTLILVIRNRGRAWLPVLITWVGYMLPAVFLLVTHFKSLGDLFYWIKTYIIIASGNSGAMSYGTIQIPALILGSIELIFYFIVTIYLFKKKSSLSYVSLIFVISVYFAFKEGFYRQDASHVIYYFLFIPLVLTTTILFAKNRKELIGSSGIFFIALMLVVSCPIFVRPDHALANNLNRISSIVTGRAGWSNIASLTKLEEIRKYVSDQSQINLEKDRLPIEWVKTIGDSTVDVVPWEISYIPKNNLKWSPNPILQTFVAFSPFLDNWCATHFSGENAPQFLIADFTDVDGRHPLLDAATTWRNIQLNYELISYDKQANRLLLKRKLDYVPENLVPVGNNKYNIGQWIKVASNNNLMYAKIDMNLTLVGKVIGMGYLIPPVNIDLIYDSGRMASWRILPDTLANGILINYVPFSSEEWSKLYLGSSKDKVNSFRISGPGANYYTNKISVEWMQVNYPIEENKVNPTKLLLVGERTLFNIDNFNNLTPTQYNSAVVIDSRNTDMINISGWAVDQKADNEAGGVLLNIDGQVDIPAFYGIDRPDVADYFGNPNYRFSGFSVSFLPSTLVPGKHVLSLKIVTSDETGYYEPGQTFTVEVNP